MNPLFRHAQRTVMHLRCQMHRLQIIQSPSALEDGLLKQICTWQILCAHAQIYGLLSLAAHKAVPAALRRLHALAA